VRLIIPNICLCPLILQIEEVWIIEQASPLKAPKARQITQGPRHKDNLTLNLQWHPWLLHRISCQRVQCSCRTHLPLEHHRWRHPAELLPGDKVRRAGPINYQRTNQRWCWHLSGEISACLCQVEESGR
jgi:hypothetical protein